MHLRWTASALSDLARLHDFLAPLNPQAAERTVQYLTQAPERLLAHPRLGERLEGFGTTEVRRLIVGSYELRYAITDDVIAILRLWHTRKAR